MKRVCVGVVALALLFVLGSTSLQAQQDDVDINVVAKNFTEEFIMGQLQKLALQAAGFSNVSVTDGLSSTALRDAMESGDGNLAMDYTGTTFGTHLGLELKPGLSPDFVYQKMAQVDLANGFVTLDRSEGHNTFAMAATANFAQNPGDFDSVNTVPDEVELPVDTMPELAALYNANDGSIPAIIDLEFAERDDGLKLLQRVYEFEISDDALTKASVGKSLQALANNEFPVGMVFATDPAIAENNFTTMADTSRAFPPFDQYAYASSELIAEAPGVATAINNMISCFPGGIGEDWSIELRNESQTVWRNLNAQVAVEDKSPEEAARSFLEDCDAVDLSS